MDKSTLPSVELAPIVQEMFYDIPLQPHEIAKLVQKPYSTLMREMNPFDSSAKLGLLTYFDITYQTGCMHVLEYMAKQLGYKLVKI